MTSELITSNLVLWKRKKLDTSVKHGYDDSESKLKEPSHGYVAIDSCSELWYEITASDACHYQIINGATEIVLLTKNP